jgi:hypothetical protein
MGLPLLANPPRHFQYHRNMTPEFTPAAPREKNYHWDAIRRSRDALRSSIPGVSVQDWISDKLNL